MKIQFSLPSNEDFFNRYATLVPTLSKLGIFAQLVSSITEIGIIYNIILSRVIEFTPMYATILATIGAIIGTAFLEIGLREFTPYSIKAFLYKRFKGLDLAMTIFILLVNFGLLFASGYLSFNGSKELIKIAAPTAQLESSNLIDSSYVANQASIQKAFKSDSLTISSGYQKQINAQQEKYKALLAQQQTRLNQYIRKEERQGLSYASRKESIKEKMAGIEADKAQQVALLEATRATELKELLDSRKTDAATVESRYLSNTNKIEHANTVTKAKAANTIKTYGNGLAYFTILCLSVFLLSTIIAEIHKKGSSIEQVALPNQYHFSDSVINEFTNMLSDKYNYYTRTAISYLADLTPAPPIPTEPTILYDISNRQQQRVLLTSSPHALPSDNNTITTETDANKAVRYLEASVKLQESNLHQEAQEMELKAEQVIQAYLGPKATTENVTRLKEQIIGFLNGENSNPFDRHHRQPIGFKTTATADTEDIDNINKTADKTAIRQPYNGNTIITLVDGQRYCLYCKISYIYKQHTQKYCSEKCRITAWQERTGRQLKKKKKN